MALAGGNEAAIAEGAILTVDLGAVRANYAHLRDLARPAECAAVVKADAYGLGAVPVARALWKEGCRTFFVAHVGEGVALRPALGPTATIFVLNGVPAGAEEACAAAGLVPAIGSVEQLRGWRDAARRLGRTLPAAIQVDTGMARLGFAPRDLDVLSEPDALDGVRIDLVLSHLARADEPDHETNKAQRRLFELLRARLPTAPASLANSSGIFLGRPFLFDMVRPGAALLGINPTPWRANPMRAVARLDARVIQTRTLEKGDAVGYGHAFRAGQAMRLATLSIGYADGWPRRVGASAWFGEAELPFVGRVSMDSLVVDITRLGSDAPRAGDLVELIGPHRSVDELGTAAGTIGYEILTGLGPRLHRRYVDG